MSMSEIQKLETLKTKLGTLNTQRTRLETQVEAARKEYERLAAEAIAQYGTADLDELRSKLQDIQATNNSALAKFETALTAYAEALGAIAKQVI